VKVKLDENIPASVASRLAQLGVDTDTVLGEGLRGRPDADVWSAAQSEERLLVTQDLDFSDKQRRPCDLPDWFWDTPEEPEFVPPAGICFTEVGEPTWDEQNRPIIPLSVSAYWLADGTYWPKEQTSIAGHEGGDVLRTALTDNEQYRLAKVEWHVEYERRRRYRS